MAAPGAGDDVEHAGRQDVRGDLGQDQGRQRRSGRRLEDDRVAGRERRSDLPAGHHDRVVPRRDRGDDADRLAPDHRGEAGHVLVDRLALHHPCAHRRRSAGCRPRPGSRRSPRRLACRRSSTRGDRARRPGPRCASASLRSIPLRSPGVVCCQVSKAVAGGLRSPVDVLGRGRLDLGDDLAVGRVLDVERLARRRIDPFAVDELLVRLDALEDVGHRFGPSGSVVGTNGQSMVSHRTPRAERRPGQRSDGGAAVELGTKGWDATRGRSRSRTSGRASSDGTIEKSVKPRAR